MGIVFGTDHSTAAAIAGRIAAAWAARSGQVLHLVHVAPTYPADHVSEERALLEDEADRLREEGARVKSHLRVGDPAAELLAVAHETEAPLVLLGAHGQTASASWRIGSVAERTAQQARIPVVVLRAGMEAWVRGERPLKVVVGHDLTPVSDAALRFAVGLRKVAPCEIVLAHVYSPAAQLARLGIQGRAGAPGHHPDVEWALERDLHARSDADGIPVLLGKIQGRPAAALLELAERANADLLVVGSHHRVGLDRLRHGSVSHAVLGHASVGIAAVSGLDPADAPLPKLHRALVATDFSDVANAAVPYAYASVGRNGVVHLVHVADVASKRGEEWEQPFADKLRPLIPAAANDLGVTTVVHVLARSDVATAICELGERVGVDLICIGARGRSGLVATVAGSTTQEVMKRSTRPVFVVRPVV